MTRAVQTALAGAGGVLQVVQTITKTARSSTSSSWTPMSDDCLITPISTSSKIVVLYTGMVQLPGSGAVNFATILRTIGGTTVPVEDYGASRGLVTAEGISGWIPLTLTVQDSPATTSQCNYRLGLKATTGNTVSSLNYGTNGGMLLSTIVMEIAA